jgi:hypothetical protein
MKFAEIVSLELGMEVNPVNLIVEVHGFMSETFAELRIQVNLTGDEELP